MEDKKNMADAKSEKEIKRNPNQEIMDEIGEGKEKVRQHKFFRHLGELSKRGEFSLFKRGVGGMIDEYRNFKSNKEDYLEKYDAYEIVVSSSTDTIEYYLLLFFSCMIALFGLLQNSPAVIIGAMIVAPLMGPIFGLAAGVMWGSRGVIREAFTTLFKGVLLVIIITAGVAWFMPGVRLTGELLARSQPTVFDLIVALSCGFIGAFSYVNKRVSSVISGVAISVALLPPLCTAGVGLGLQNWALARGAGLLFGVNLAGIILASSIVFYLVRLHPKSYDQRDYTRLNIRAITQIVFSLVLLTSISVPLIVYTGKSHKLLLTREKIERVLLEEFPQVRLYELELQENLTNRVDIVLLHDDIIDPSVLSNMKASIQACSEKHLDLRVYFLRSSD